MSKNSQIEILTRVIALALSDGDTQKAEEIIAWAASGKTEKSEKKPRDRTATFVKKYLSPNAPYDKEKIERFINQNIVKTQNGVDFQVVKNKIRNMPYADFLKTIYWRGVSLFVKRRDGWKCTACGSTEKIEVHHKTYENHGAETEHLEDLTTLCDNCHKKAHKMEKQETAPTTTIRVRTRRPKTGSALSISDIVAEKEIEDAWSALVEKCSYRPRVSSALAKSTVTIQEPENGKQIIAFTLTNEAQVRWVEEKFLRDMERDLKEIVGREDIELRAKVRQS